MKVFISSVRYLLKDERKNLPALLKLLDHEPLRFEDFGSKDTSSREACVAGVEAADVYVLLLGPKYGDPFPDTGLAPTHEEFQIAKRRGIPILVFVKNTEEPDEPAQAEFKKEVGHYVNGRFWSYFDDSMNLNIAVGEALKALPPADVPFRLLTVAQPPAVAWLNEPTGLRPRGVAAPVLELHLIPTGPPIAVAGAGALAATAKSLARDIRSIGLVTDNQALDTGSDNTRAWAARPAHAEHQRSNSAFGWTEEAWSGAAVTADGAAVAWLSLPKDMFGSLVQHRDVRGSVAQMTGLLAPYVADSEQVAVAVRLSPADGVKDGDPSQLGHRSSGSGSLRGPLAVVQEPTFAVDAAVLTRSGGDLASEIATRLMNDIRQIPGY